MSKVASGVTYLIITAIYETYPATVNSNALYVYDLTPAYLETRSSDTRLSISSAQSKGS
jgi:hypothetical protein